MAKKATLYNHLIGTNIVAPLPDIYGNINTITGISKVNADNPLPTDYKTFKTINQVAALGIVRRAKAQIGTGASKKLKTIYLLAANAPQVGALKSLKYGADDSATDTIVNAYFPATYKYG